MEEFHDLYDRVAKRCLTLSNRAVILLINGLYHTDYPLDSQLSYQWTEHEDEDLRRTLEDGFYHALKQQSSGDILEFPEPILICLYENRNESDMECIRFRFGEQGEFLYRVPVLKYLNFSVEELNQRHLIVLLPFQLLKLRKAIEKERTKTNLEALKALVTHDIIDTIRMNIDAGNLTLADARKLKRMTLQLFHHIYDRYGELEEEGVNQSVEEALILDIDIIEKEHRDELRALEEKAHKGTDIQKISETTGLSLEEITQLIT